MKDKDPNHCGLEPFTTGDWDPQLQACRDHDAAFEALKAGKDTKGPWRVAGEFILGATVQAAKGAYAVATLPIYILVGGVGGILRWGQIEGRRTKGDPPSDKKWTDE